MINKLISKIVKITQSNVQESIKKFYTQILFDMFVFAFMGFVCFIGLLLLGISGALYLGEILSSTYQGFFIVGAIYTIIFLFTFIFFKLFCRD